MKIEGILDTGSCRLVDIPFDAYHSDILPPQSYPPVLIRRGQREHTKPLLSYCTYLQLSTLIDG